MGEAAISSRRHGKPSSRFGRKWRKLRRDPIGFVRDARLLRPFLMPRRPRRADDSVAVPHYIARFTPSAVEVQPGLKRPLGFVTGLLHPEAMAEQLLTPLFDALHAQEDISMVRKARLQLGTFALDPAETAPALLARMSQAARDRLGRMDHVLVIDGPPALHAVLRAIKPGLRVIAIGTADGPLPDARQADALIWVGAMPQAVAAQPWRRILPIAGMAQLPAAIRLLLLESYPKTPDMLLPLIAAERYQRDAFFTFETRMHQGVIAVAGDAMPQGATLRSLCRDLASRIRWMAVTESVYLRYRTLCEAVEAGAAADELLVQCLEDGVLFDVRPA